MKFENRDELIYCKNGSYQKEYGNKNFYCIKGITYYKGYLVHRKDGPAMYFKHICVSNWFLNGIKYIKKDYWKIIKSLKTKKRVLDDI
jgi:hypothetical protein